MDKLSLRWTAITLAMLLSAILADQDFKQCSEGQTSEPTSMEDEDADLNIFDDLTIHEMNAVIAYVAENLGAEQDPAKANMRSCFIYFIEGLPPAKAAALAYLDGEGPKPDRFAKVVLYRGDLTPPHISELKVGPLPLPSSHEEILHSNWKTSEIPFSHRSPYTVIEIPRFETFLIENLGPVDHLLQEATGYRYTNCSDRCLRWVPTSPGSFVEGDRRIVWLHFHRFLEGHFLHPIGLQIKVDITDAFDDSQWQILHVWFKGKHSSQLNASTFQMTASEPVTYDRDDPNLYSTLKQKGEPLPEDPQRGPKQVLPDGRRWSVRGHHIDWQGWSFDLNMRTQLGLQIHDVRFQEHRVAYEVSLSEIGVLYSGYSPSPQHTTYVDSIIPFGRAMYKVLPDADCPKFATYFDFVHYFYFRPLTFTNSACVFEWNTGVPIRRRYETDYNDGHYYYQTMLDNVLILRAMLSTGNYEYMLDYVFHQNGVLEVRCSLSGYVLASYYTGQEDNRYGFEIFPDGIGNIHNHLVQFKVDLDVDGTANRFETLDVNVAQVNDPTETGNPPIYTRAITHNLRESEMNATIKTSSQKPRYLLLVNNQSTNAYGNRRAYRIIPRDTSALLQPDDASNADAFSWAKYQVAVTRHHDDEEAGSTMYSGISQLDPPFSFNDMLEDDENIVDQDLVAWVTLGTLHIPHSEDIPVVQTPSVQLSFLLQPYNFFNEDPSLRSRDNFRSERTWTGDYEVQYVGVEPGLGCKTPTETSSAERGTHFSFATLFGLCVCLAFC